MKIVDKLLGKKSFVDEAKKLGVNIGKNVIIAEGIDWGTEPYLISIGDDSLVSLRVTFINHDGSINVLRNLKNDHTMDIIKPIKIGKNCFIGAESLILYGTNIGDNVIVGARSLVKGELESGFVYAGSPAKKICTVEEFYKKHEGDILHTKQLSPEEKEKFLRDKYLS